MQKSTYLTNTKFLYEPVFPGKISLPTIFQHLFDFVEEISTYIHWYARAGLWVHGTAGTRPTDSPSITKQLPTGHSEFSTVILHFQHKFNVFQHKFGIRDQLIPAVLKVVTDELRRYQKMLVFFKFYSGLVFQHKFDIFNINPRFFNINSVFPTSGSELP